MKLNTGVLFKEYTARDSEIIEEKAGFSDIKHWVCLHDASYLRRDTNKNISVWHYILQLIILYLLDLH